MRRVLSWPGRLGVVALLLGALCTALWWWGGRASSLQSVLEIVHYFLPQSQRLEFNRVSGSVWHGGKIAQLRWSDAKLQVEAHDLDVQWDLTGVLQQKLLVPRLSMALLRIDDQRPASPVVVPTDAQLPLQLDVHWDVGALVWGPSPTVRAERLRGHYAFDGARHRVEVREVSVAAGSYQLKADLQAQSPMALHAEVSGMVLTKPTPTGKPLRVDATAIVSGALGSVDASLDLQIRLHPETSANSSDAMQGELQAQVAPWRAPWVTTAKAQWRSLDLAALWPQAPVTLMDGAAEVAPQGAGWHGSVTGVNRRSGPWTDQRLPIQHVNARVSLLEGEWSIESLRASVGAGQIEAQARYRSGADWRGNATLTGVNPAAIDPRWEAVPVDGELVARQTSAGIHFDAQLHSRAQGQPTRVAKFAKGLQFQQLQAQGFWAQPALRIDSLRLTLSDAQLNAKVLIDTDQWSGSGTVDGTLPGAQWHATGDLSPTAGLGEAQLAVADVEKASAWVQRFGVGASGWGSRSMQGTVKAAVRWAGGWKEFGEGMDLHAHVDVPSLQLGSDPTGRAPWRVKDLHASVGGRPSALSVTVSGLAEQNAMDYGLKSSGVARRTAPGQWDGQLQLLELSAWDQAAKERWLLQLESPTDVRWRRDLVVQTLTLAQGTARVTGPAAGAVRLAWMPASWSQRAQVVNGTVGPSTQWDTQGQISELPLEWLTHAAGHGGLKQGLVGDLVFGGSWSASGLDKSLTIQALLRRTRGDLQVNADDANPNLAAGVRQAQISLRVVDARTDVEMLWSSDNAGTLQASGSTRLNFSDGGWGWRSDAPLQGQLRASLPRLGGWSMLAPPGWRLRGTLDARAELSGTRQTPVWNGTLTAKELSVRSVVDGIDFNKGSMRLELTGDGLEIADFNLQGVSGGGTNGGTLSLTGAVRWPASANAAQHAAHWSMDVLATAKSLRVSARADRRLIVSGSIGARLDSSRLVIDGALAADQGAFTLAQDTVPVLDSDVRIGKGVAVQGSAQTESSRGGFVLAKSIDPRVHVTLDLGPQFQVEGYGLRSRLEGKLVLSTVTQNLQPRLHGEIQTVDGSYKAYGQQLDIEAGVVRFAGPFDNPTLDILAIRPNLTQRVGVQIIGTALVPSVRLYAEPELPDAEKLSWLVVGHANADGSAQMALVQQAAMAAMSTSGQPWSTNLANSLGLDEISVSGLGTNNESAASAGATLRIGKRIAGNFYVAYERSVAGAYGTFSIFYDLSKHLTLRGQTGEQSAADLIYTTRYD